MLTHDPSSTAPAPGRLTVVGTGIGAREQIIPAAVAAITDASLVLYQIDDPATAAWLHDTNATSRAVVEPDGGGPLSESVYEAIAAEVADAVQAGAEVCFVTYGHPGVYQHAAHRAIEIVRGSGLSAEMVPGISALDCLVADLGVDLATGCVVLDATAVALQHRVLDPTLALVVFQIGIAGNPYHGADRPIGLDLVLERLGDAWGPDHEIVVYEAPMTTAAEPVVARLPLRDLAAGPITARSMLYIPAAQQPTTDVVAAARLAAELAAEPPPGAGPR